jgi:hypothetical protein
MAVTNGCSQHTLLLSSSSWYFCVFVGSNRKRLSPRAPRI